MRERGEVVDDLGVARREHIVHGVAISDVDPVRTSSIDRLDGVAGARTFGRQVLADESGPAGNQRLHDRPPETAARL